MSKNVKSISKKLAYWASVTTLGIVLGVSFQFAKAWTEPTAPAPGGNVEAPINKSSVTQTKAGQLNVVRKLEVGDSGRNYLPAGNNWDYTLQLNGQDTTSIGFHDAGQNVGSIRFRNNMFSIGADDGWGVADVTMPGNAYIYKNASISGNASIGGSASISRGLSVRNASGAASIFSAYNQAGAKKFNIMDNGTVNIGGSPNYTYSLVASYQSGRTSPRCPCDTTSINVECNNFESATDLGATCYDWDSMSRQDIYNRVGTPGGVTVTSTGAVGISEGLDVGNAGGAYTYITLRDDESPTGVKYIHANSNLVGFLRSDGYWNAYWDNAGNSWQRGGAAFTGTISAPSISFPDGTIQASARHGQSSCYWANNGVNPGKGSTPTCGAGYYVAGLKNWGDSYGAISEPYCCAF